MSVGVAAMEPQIRRVTESDRDDMMRIARLTWGGYDYLPFAFDEWLKDPKCYTFGIEIDGHLVGLNNLRIIDDGRTGWMEGLRVHRDYRKHGLARLLTKHIVEFSEGTGVSRVRYTTDTTNDASLKLGEEVGMHRVFDMGVFWALTDKIEPVRKLGRKLTKMDGTSLYEQLLSSQDLVLNDMLIFDWKAVEVSRSSLSALEEKCQFWSTARSGLLESFSVGLDRKEMKGTEWSFTIYAHNDEAFLFSSWPPTLIREEAQVQRSDGHLSASAEESTVGKSFDTKRKQEALCTDTAGEAVRCQSHPFLSFLKACTD